MGGKNHFRWASSGNNSLRVRAGRNWKGGVMSTVDRDSETHGMGSTYSAGIRAAHSKSARH